MTSSTEKRDSSIDADVAVIGAGPAGLAAAVEAALGGAAVVLIDAGARFGGQFWRQGPDGLAADSGLHHDIDVFTDLSARAKGFIAQGQIHYLPRHHVWSLISDAGDASDATGGTLGVLDATDPGEPADVVVNWRYLVLAPGAFDRQLPFPGWDLPGVMTVGAAQSLLKGSGVVVGPRVMVAGTGPFLLPVAAALAARGARVVGVHEANRPSRWLRRLPVLIASPKRIGEGAAYLATLARHRVRLKSASIVVAAHGTERLEAVTVAKVDRSGARIAGPGRRVPVDVLAVGYGFSTQSELPLAAGCRMQVTADQTLAAVTDEHQATSNPRVFAAGEITGVGGAQLAVVEGAIAGAAVARAASSASAGARSVRGRPARHRSLQRFAAALPAVYPIPTAWLDGLEPETVICRCEEVTLAEIDEAIELGANDPRTVKLLSRAGMGWCQGRECGYATACILARRTGTSLNLATGAERPIATPIPLGLVADGPT